MHSCLPGRYTLLEQEPIEDLLPRCRTAGTSIVIGGPLNSGILAGRSTWNYRRPHLRSPLGPMPSKQSATAITCLSRQQHCNTHLLTPLWPRSSRARATSRNFTAIWSCSGTQFRRGFGRTFAMPDCSIPPRRPPLVNWPALALWAPSGCAEREGEAGPPAVRSGVE